MGRRVFEGFEAVSAVVPSDDGYQAAIAVKALVDGGAPQFHRILEGKRFARAFEADEAAGVELAGLAGVTPEGELVWR
jgi:hypothetical protein